MRFLDSPFPILWHHYGTQGGFSGQTCANLPILGSDTLGLPTLLNTHSPLLPSADCIVLSCTCFPSCPPSFSITKAGFRQCSRFLKIKSIHFRSHPEVLYHVVPPAGFSLGVVTSVKRKTSAAIYMSSRSSLAERGIGCYICNNCGVRTVH
jgi:hypothetical protein